LRATCWGILLVWVYRNLLVFLGAPEEYIYTAFDTRVDHLLVGCAVAISLRYGYFSRFWRIVCARDGYILLPLGCLVLSALAAIPGGTHYRDTVGFIVDPLSMAILIVQLLASRSHWLAWMDSAPLVYLGTISYSTYLYHGMAGDFVISAVGGLPKPVVIIGVVFATYLAASISYYAVERPFLRLRARIDSRQPRTRTVKLPVA
jgi:peptidoglycan/LPS O-acetylase OafA/YrhL